jgi:hypothetical protein
MNNGFPRSPVFIQRACSSLKKANIAHSIAMDSIKKILDRLPLPHLNQRILHAESERQSAQHFVFLAYK